MDKLDFSSVLMYMLYLMTTGVYLAEELISPLLTPFILYFNVRHRALDFVDFLRNYTVNVVG